MRTEDVCEEKKKEKKKKKAPFVITGLRCKCAIMINLLSQQKALYSEHCLYGMFKIGLFVLLVYSCSNQSGTRP